jgi:hypothetical protein
MNTLSIAPQLIMNVLQNMNIKRDTLEKRAAIVKSQFQETTTVNSNNANADANAAAANAEYDESSVEAQYLPKSLRGTNPYSIMNEMTEHVASSTDNNIGPSELETSIASAAIVSTNEVIIQSQELSTTGGL